MRDRLAATVWQDAAVVHVTVVGAVHGDLKAVGVTGFDHELLGGFDVIRQALDVGLKPLMPGPTISADGFEARRITVFLMPSMSMAW